MNSVPILQGFDWPYVVSLQIIHANKPIWRGNSILNQSISNGASGSVITAENTLEASDITYLNGELTFNASGTFSIFLELHVDATSGNNAEIQTWIEYDVGLGYQIYPYSGRFVEFRERTEGIVSYKSDIPVLRGTKFRLKAMAALGSIQLISKTFSNGVVSPSTLVSIVKI